MFSVVFISSPYSHLGSAWVLPKISLLLTNTVLPVRACKKNKESLSLVTDKFHNDQCIPLMLFFSFFLGIHCKLYRLGFLHVIRVNALRCNLERENVARNIFLEHKPNRPETKLNSVFCPCTAFQNERQFLLDGVSPLVLGCSLDSKVLSDRDRR